MKGEDHLWFSCQFLEPNGQTRATASHTDTARTRQDLVSYTDVDPAAAKGQSYMDSGEAMLFGGTPSPGRVGSPSITLKHYIVNPPRIA